MRFGFTITTMERHYVSRYGFTELNSWLLVKIYRVATYVGFALKYFLGVARDGAIIS